MAIGIATRCRILVCHRLPSKLGTPYDYYGYGTLPGNTTDSLASSSATDPELYNVNRVRVHTTDYHNGEKQSQSLYSHLCILLCQVFRPVGCAELAASE